MKKGVYYLIPKEELHQLLKQLKNNQITIYDLINYNQDYYLFYTSYYDSFRLEKLIPHLVYYQSVGFMHYIRLFFTSKYRVFGLLFSLCLFLYLSQLSYGCLIEKQYPAIDQMIVEKCKSYGISQISTSLNYLELEKIQNDILDELKDTISYLELYKEGKFYKLKYLKKVKDTPKQPSYKIFLASNDAIIDLIDIRSGNVLVERGQYVSKGDILVSNEIISTDDTSKLVEVDGKIFGYVYHTIESNVKGELNVDTFSYLYQEISKKISYYLQDDGHIVSENVLQYTKKEGKIVLKVQFTLYQNIAQEGFINE